MDQPRPMATVLARYMAERDVGLERLAKASVVPKQTIEHWLRSEVAFPYQTGHILRVAAALHLPAVSTEWLLQAAGQPSLGHLLENASDAKTRDLLDTWRPVAPHNLPSPLSSFVGRGVERLELAELLCRDDVRLVTLTGPGGSGKTRLAIEVARTLLDAFRDGVCFVDLGALASPTLAIATIARTLRLPGGDSSPSERLAGHLAERRVLLLLDNFEHLLAAGPELAALLAATQHAKILVTSRAPLRISGEREWPVRPLAVPAKGTGLPGTRRSPAVALFVARAQAVSAHFRLTPDNAPDVAAICAGLDGLPLAIELAAARARGLTPAELRVRFPSGLDMAADGPRDLPLRQQTLRATLDWSYALLDEGAQRLLAGLGVFAGGATAEAVAAVCGGGHDQPADVAAGSGALAAGGLVRRTLDTAGGVRLTMLETIREYALERLAASGAAHVLRQRHADYCLSLTERPAGQAAPMKDWLDRLEIERDNLRAALCFLRETEASAQVLRLAAALWPFWNHRGYTAEGRDWLEWALRTTPDGDVALRVEARNGAAALAVAQGACTCAAMHYAEALADARRIGDGRRIGRLLNHLGNIRQLQGAYAEAESLCGEALARQRPAGDDVDVAQTLHTLGNVAYALGEHDRAAERYGEAIALQRAARSPSGIATGLNWLGRVRAAQGDHVAAQRLHAEALELTRTIGDAWGIASSLALLGRSLIRQGGARRERGITYLAEALPRLLDVGDRRGVAAALRTFAEMALGDGRLVCATRLLAAADAQRRSAGAVLTAADRLVRERTEAALRARLSPEEFAAGWKEGQNLSLQQAANYALTDRQTDDQFRQWLQNGDRNGRYPSMTSLSPGAPIAARVEVTLT